MKKNQITAGHLLALFTIFIWGITFISTKILLKDFKPVEILFYRFVIGYTVLTIIHPHRLRVKRFREELIMAAAGLCGITLYYLLENIALTFSMASNIGIIVSIAPLFTGILASIFLDGERLKLNFILGFFTAISGIILISFHASTALRLNPLGDFLALSAAAVWAVYSILSRKIGFFGYNTIQTTRRIFMYGLIFMLPSLPFFGFRLNPGRLENPVNLLNILFLGLGASALCFVTWNTAVKILGAVKTSIYIYLVPVITVLASIIILKEIITAVSTLGMLLTMAGLLISKNDRRDNKIVKQSEVYPVQQSEK